jgi:hypothetical protein
MRCEGQRWADTLAIDRVRVSGLLIYGQSESGSGDARTTYKPTPKSEVVKPVGLVTDTFACPQCSPRCAVPQARHFAQSSLPRAKRYF